MRSKEETVGKSCSQRVGGFQAKLLLKLELPPKQLEQGRGREGEEGEKQKESV